MNFLTGPTVNYYLDILFPADSDRPRFQWYPTIHKYGTRVPEPTFAKQLIAPDSTALEVGELSFANTVGRKHEHNISYYHRSDYLKDEVTRKNLSISLATGSPTAFCKRGNSSSMMWVASS